MMKRIFLAMILGTAAAAAAQTTPDALLLKDYRPRSIYNIPRTRIEKARWPVIDQHSHEYYRGPVEIDRWVQAMDAAGVRKVVVMTQKAGPAFDDALARFKKHPDRFDVWCGIDFEGCGEPGWPGRACAELERCAGVGAVGVGELVDKGRGFAGKKGGAGNPLHVDDPRMDPILEKCADLGLPINVHVAEDCWMYEPLDEHNDGLMNAAKWHIENRPEILQHDALVQTLAKAAKKHPRTIFIACHYANWCADLGKLGAMFDALPNLYADMGARFGETAPIPRFMKKFITTYQDRILYGTDNTPGAELYRETFRILETEDEHFYGNAQYHWPLNGFGLSDAVLKKVYHDNAETVLRRAKESKKSGSR